MYDTRYREMIISSSGVHRDKTSKLIKIFRGQTR